MSDAGAISAGATVWMPRSMWCDPRFGSVPGPWAPAVPAGGGTQGQRGNLLHGVAQLGIELASKDRVIHACMPVVLGVASPVHLHLHHGRGMQVPHQGLVDRGDRSQRLHRQSDSLITDCPVPHGLLAVVDVCHR